MVGGLIKDYYRISKDRVEFLVQGTGYEKFDQSCVEVEIPDIVYKELEKGAPIWWHRPNIYLQVYGCEDVPFRRISQKDGGAVEFLKRKAESMSLFK